LIGLQLRDRKCNQPHEGASIAPAKGAEPVVRFITRLSPEVYKVFENKIALGPFIDKSAPDAGCDAAFKLGIQYVLKQLRAELVVE
jgi:hypothetical protein